MRFGIAAAAGATWLSMFLAAAPGAAQDTVTIADSATCPSCRIELGSVMISDEGADGHFGDFLGLSADRSGRIFVVSSVEPYAIMIFDSAGRYMRSFGRAGDGPGEYRFALPPVPTVGDTLLVFDVSRRRMTILGPSFEVVRSSALTFVVRGAAVLPDGRIVVNADPMVPNQAGRPLHVLGPQGAVLESWGDVNAPVPSYQSWENRRRLASDQDGRLWTARPNDYLVEEWDSAGRRVTQLRLEATWLPRWDEAVTRPDSVPPNPVIVKVWREGDLLWVASLVADQRWRPLRSSSDNPGDVTIRGLDRNRVWDTRIDVIDITNYSLLATARFDPYLIPGFAGAVFAEYQETADLSPRFVIHRPTLVRGR